MTRKQFEESYCNKSHISIEEYDKYFVTLPCNCGDDTCKGWACVTKREASIKAHKELYNYGLCAGVTCEC